MKIHIIGLAFLLALAPSLRAEDIRTEKSRHSFNKTVHLLLESIKSKGLTHFKTISHHEGAEKVHLELRPTSLIIFGNPKVGTLMMQKNQMAGLDLPLSILVFKDKGGVTQVSYRDINFIRDQYKVKGLDKVFSKVRRALREIVKSTK